MVKKILLLLIALLALAQSIGSTTGGIKIKIKSNKDSYYLYEPVEIEYKITLIGNHPVSFDRLALMYTLDIMDDSGSQLSHCSAINTFRSITLRPDSSIVEKIVIENRYQMNEVRNYSIEIKFSGVEYTPKCSSIVDSNPINILSKLRSLSIEDKFNGNEYSPKYSSIIYSNPINISIIAPGGKDREALSQLLLADPYNPSDAQLKTKRFHSIRDDAVLELSYSSPSHIGKYETLIQIADSFPNSVYAPIALYKAQSIFDYDHEISQLSLCKRIIEDYPEFWKLEHVFAHKIYIYIGDDQFDLVLQYLDKLIKISEHEAVVELARNWVDFLNQETSH